MNKIAFLLLLVGFAFGNDISWLLSDYSSSPARFANPGFSMDFYRLPETDQLASSVSGEWGDSRYRGAFIGSYESMDSLYRKIYTEWGMSVNGDWLAVGGAYGFSMEWTPGDELWTSHRYKAGASIVYGRLILWTYLWNFFHEPLKNMQYLSGVTIKPGDSLDAFFQWDGRSAYMGSSLNFRFVSLSTFYRFPGFCVGLGMNFHFDLWNVGGSIGKSDHSLDWFGLSVKKKIGKKTIL